jgi:hypothetical protein
VLLADNITTSNDLSLAENVLAVLEQIRGRKLRVLVLHESPGERRRIEQNFLKRILAVKVEKFEALAVDALKSHKAGVESALLDSAYAIQLELVALKLTVEDDVSRVKGTQEQVNQVIREVFTLSIGKFDAVLNSFAEVVEVLLKSDLSRAKERAALVRSLVMAKKRLGKLHEGKLLPLYKLRLFDSFWSALEDIERKTEIRGSLGVVGKLPKEIGRIEAKHLKAFFREMQISFEESRVQLIPALSDILDQARTEIFSEVARDGSLSTSGAEVLAELNSLLTIVQGHTSVGDENLYDPFDSDLSDDGDDNPFPLDFFGYKKTRPPE